MLPVELSRSRLNPLSSWSVLLSVFRSFSTLVMQLSATIIIAFLFSLLSLRVLGHPHRVIRPRPGSPHRGSGLGGGGIIPFSSKTHTKRSLSASTPNSPVRPGVASVPATLTPQTPFESTPLLSTYLSLHNELRKQYAAKPLSWSTTLASAAQQWASNCQYGHSSMTYGENIAAGTAENFTAQDAFDIWASENPQHSSADPVPSHFTQLIWKGTTHVGCAMASCAGLLGDSSVAYYFVCEYEPAGNIVGKFTENVQ